MSDAPTLPPAGPVEYAPLSPLEVAELRAKQAQGLLGREDCARFVASIRASFLARTPAKAAAKPAKVVRSGPALTDEDFDL